MEDLKRSTQAARERRKGSILLLKLTKKFTFVVLRSGSLHNHVEVYTDKMMLVWMKSSPDERL